MTVSTHGEVIKVEAPISALETLFATEMAVYMHKTTRKTLVRNLGKSSVPAHLKEHVLLVEGLHEFPALPHARAGRAMGAAEALTPNPSGSHHNGGDDDTFGNNTLSFYSVNFPLSIWALYNIPNNTAVTNAGATQGCFAQFAAGMSARMLSSPPFPLFF